MDIITNFLLTSAKFITFFCMNCKQWRYTVVVKMYTQQKNPHYILKIQFNEFIRILSTNTTLLLPSVIFYVFSGFFTNSWKYTLLPYITIFSYFIKLMIYISCNDIIKGYFTPKSPNQFISVKNWRNNINLPLNKNGNIPNTVSPCIIVKIYR